MTDSSTQQLVGLAVSLGTLATLLAKMLYDRVKGDTPGEREKRQRAAEDRADEEHRRLEREVRQVEAKAAKALAEMEDRIEQRLDRAMDKMQLDMEAIRKRLHDMSNTMNIGLGNISVVDERTKHLTDDVKRVEAKVERMDGKVDELLRVMVRREGA